ncbi:hypothetical protein J2Z32_003457 [Paenibacillus turicensis]|uniref:Bacteriocin biosynthesis protein n=1 Tax=Paenibacillus turicensis TaxID=160487 RepID=A0ABS4FWT1_9BACL|nr:BhlA/UviB family holin-like peptide [Paenibacillus turicensis]MBP1906793.1 hypothetical protein [Paenibacillus turicensis]
METEIWKYFITQGPFAVLFIWAWLSSQKRERESAEDSKAREKELNAIIKQQTDVMQTFSEKYDLIVIKLEHIEGRLK